MDLAVLSEFTDGRQVYRWLDGDAVSFGLGLGAGPALEDSYCALMAAGVIDGAIPDAAVEPAVRDLPGTAGAGIGSYVGAPVRLSDGSLYGSLCGISHDARPVDAKDARLLSLLADLLAADLDREVEDRRARARVSAVIDDDRLDIALQPVVDLAGGTVIGVEALSRFDPCLGAPDAVFAEAHRLGLGPQLERHAVRRALALLPLLTDDLFLAVNLSPATALELTDMVGRDDLPMDRLVLEMTEHVAVEDYSELRRRLAPARRRGVRLSIDDAGAGYSSLQHIVELGPDIIKIDRSLIDGVWKDPVRRSVVGALVALAHETGADVVAEGVEELADLTAAEALGVDHVQGYLLARPSTDRALLSRWRAARYSFRAAADALLD